MSKSSSSSTSNSSSNSNSSTKSNSDKKHKYKYDTSSSYGQSSKELFFISNQSKWLIALIVAILFFILSSNYIYTWTNKISTSLGFKSFYTSEGPSLYGILIHTVLVMLIIRLMLGY